MSLRKLLAAIAALSALAGCSNAGHGVALGPNREKVVHVAPHFAKRAITGTVELRAPGAALRVVIAADKATLTRGLAGRQSLARHSGMLFVAPWPNDHLLTMWMKDTYVPVDMVFVSNAGVVTSIARNVPAGLPNTPDYRISRRFGRGHYVIELPGGESVHDGIATGTRFAIPRQIAAL